MSETRLYHAGIPTLMGSPVGTLENLKPGSYAAVGIPYDYASGSRPGARWGPRAVRQSSMYFDYFLRSSPDSEYVDISTGKVFSIADPVPMVDLGDIEVFPMDLERTLASIAGFIRTIMEKKATPIILGGDHLITYPCFSGFFAGQSAAGILPSEIAYIHIDSHLDMFDDHPAWGRYYHGSTVRRIAEVEGFDPANILLIGVHGLVGKETYDFVRNKGIHLVTLNEITSEGVENAVRAGMEKINASKKRCYVSIDIDAVGSAFAPGTGGISLEGMTPAQLQNTVSIVTEFEVHALDIVEIAPNYDSSERTQRLAADILFTFISQRRAKR